MMTRRPLGSVTRTTSDAWGGRAWIPGQTMHSAKATTARAANIANRFRRKRPFIVYFLQRADGYSLDLTLQAPFWLSRFQLFGVEIARRAVGHNNPRAKRATFQVEAWIYRVIEKGGLRVKGCAFSGGRWSVVISEARRSNFSNSRSRMDTSSSRPLRFIATTYPLTSRLHDDASAAETIPGPIACQAIFAACSREQRRIPSTSSGQASFAREGRRQAAAPKRLRRQIALTVIFSDA